MLRIAQEALTFDDVLLVPGYSDITAKDVSLKTRLTRDIELNIPMVAAAMDTVTESRLAISIAQEGGIGIIHKSMTVEQQAAQVRRSGIPRQCLQYRHSGRARRGTATA
jgi:IMP dehydrogenase